VRGVSGPCGRSMAVAKREPRPRVYQGRGFPGRGLGNPHWYGRYEERCEGFPSQTPGRAQRFLTACPARTPHKAFSGRSALALPSRPYTFSSARFLSAVRHCSTNALISVFTSTLAESLRVSCKPST